MDWATQPNPFRFYKNCPVHELPFLKTDPDLPAKELFNSSMIKPKPYSLPNIAALLELSLGLAAWKEISGTKWSLRMNPSSGNLHPTEAYLMLTQSPELESGLYHYNPFLHALEERTVYPRNVSGELVKAVLPNNFLIGLSSIFWRESWKYGERAFRYCQHDIGHALAALRYSSALLGWQVSVVQNITDDNLSKVMGFDKTQWLEHETEWPEVLCLVQTSPDLDPGTVSLEHWINLLDTLSPKGTLEALSPGHHPWPIIEEVAMASEKKDEHAPEPFNSEPNYSFKGSEEIQAATLIRSRRSAQHFNREKSLLSKDNFLDCLAATLPSTDRPPFDSFPIQPRVHEILFVHHVTDIPSGIYALIRNPDHLPLLKSGMHDGFIWKPLSSDLPLYLLSEGDYRETAMLVSCKQDIAGDSAFSLGMIAEFDSIIQTNPYLYKQLFWECGMIGQTLYLQAEAIGLRGTGIGCFFDDAMNQKICGFKDTRFQSLYHFTVGYPIEDTRLSTLKPYHHLKPDNHNKS